MNPIPQEKVVAAYQAAPQHVREAFSSEVTSKVVMDMKAKYRLHVDAAGTIGHEVGYLLLGLRSPAEFFGGLMLLGTDEQTARGIMEEINERIFLPLKRQMSGTPSAPVAPENYTATSEPVTPMREEASIPVPKPSFATVPSIDYTPSPKTSVTLPGSPVEVPLSRGPQSIRIPVPTVHEETPLPAAPSIVPPLPNPSPAPVYRAPEPVQPPSNPQPAPVPTSTPAPIRKEYGADPYREPL